jgi:hypothetical protein
MMKLKAKDLKITENPKRHCYSSKGPCRTQYHTCGFEYYLTVLFIFAVVPGSKSKVFVIKMKI